MGFRGIMEAFPELQVRQRGRSPWKAQETYLDGSPLISRRCSGETHKGRYTLTSHLWDRLGHIRPTEVKSRYGPSHLPLWFVS